MEALLNVLRQMALDPDLTGANHGPRR